MLARTLLVSLASGVIAASCIDWSRLESGRCGDGIVGPEERCDDGNRKSGDGCDTRCQLECKVLHSPAETRCDATGAIPDAGCELRCEEQTPLCGNSVVNEGEGCDDGNTKAGDGCDAHCVIEPERPLCGNNVVDDDEICDDGNDSNTDACLNGCNRATCGDGQVRAHVEECDVVSGSDVVTCSACVRCPPEPNGYFSSRDGHCYTFHKESLSRPQARMVCQAEGGDLWTIASAGEADAAVGAMNLSGIIWIGRSRNGMSESWISGEPTTFSNYAQNEPSAAGSCIAMRADGVANAWLARGCSRPTPFVCERASASIWLPSNIAYKVRTGAATADDARSRCLDEGGHLAALETPEEHDHVARLANLDLWVDAQEVTNNVFVWSSGVPVSDSVQLDDVNGTQNCLLLQTDDQLVDRECTYPAAFVCEFD